MDPSDGDFELREVSSILETGGYLFLSQIGKLLDDGIGVVACGEIAEDEAYRNPSALDPGLASKHIRGADDLSFPVPFHDEMLADGSR